MTHGGSKHDPAATIMTEDANVPPLCIVILSQPYSDLSSASASFSEGPFWRMICRLLSSTSKAGWFALDVINTNSFAKEQK